MEENITNILSAFYIKSQLPLDAKAYCLELSDLTNLGEYGEKPFEYYEGLRIYCNEDKNVYEWREEQENNRTGLLTKPFTYPEGAELNGVIYTDREFNFYRIYEDIKLNSPDNSITITNNENIKVNTEGWNLSQRYLNNIDF